MDIDPSIEANLAAAADTILPGNSSTGAHLRVAALFDHAMENFPMLVSSLLDAYASDVVPGARFAELDDDQRSSVLTTMMADPSVDVRDVVDGLFIFSLGQYYSEANPQHVSVWERLGYHGPSEGIPESA